MTSWFTSDQHHLHANIIQYCNRPFNTVDEMQSTLVERHNGVVKPSDTVYHLGDFCHWDFDKFPEALKLLKNLNGHHVLIRGNHDAMASCLPVWQEICDFKVINIQGVKVVMSHYAFRVWPDCFRGSINLFGHSHGRLSENSQQCDVGVDSWDYRPVSLGQIVEKLKTLPAYVPEDFVPGQRTP